MCQPQRSRAGDRRGRHGLGQAVLPLRRHQNQGRLGPRLLHAVPASGHVCQCCCVGHREHRGYTRRSHQVNSAGALPAAQSLRPAQPVPLDVLRTLNAPPLTALSPWLSTVSHLAAQKPGLEMRLWPWRSARKTPAIHVGQTSRGHHSGQTCPSSKEQAKRFQEKDKMTPKRPGRDARPDWKPSYQHRSCLSLRARGQAGHTARSSPRYQRANQ